MATIHEERKEILGGYYKKVAEKFGVSESYARLLATSTKRIKTDIAHEINDCMRLDLERLKQATSKGRE